MMSTVVGDGSTPCGAPEKTLIVVKGGGKRLVELMDINRYRSCEERLRALTEYREVFFYC